MKCYLLLCEIGFLSIHGVKIARSDDPSKHFRKYFAFCVEICRKQTTKKALLQATLCKIDALKFATMNIVERKREFTGIFAHFREKCANRDGQHTPARTLFNALLADIVCGLLYILQYPLIVLCTITTCCTFYNIHLL